MNSSAWMTHPSRRTSRVGSWSWRILPPHVIWRNLAQKVWPRSAFSLVPAQPRVVLPKSNDTTNRTRKSTNNTLAIHAAVPAIPANPSKPARIAMIKKLNDQPNIGFLSRRPTLGYRSCWLRNLNRFARRVARSFVLPLFKPMPCHSAPTSLHPVEEVPVMRILVAARHLLQIDGLHSATRRLGSILHSASLGERTPPKC